MKPAPPVITMRRPSSIEASVVAGPYRLGCMDPLNEHRSEAETQLYQAIVDRLSFALENARLIEETSRPAVDAASSSILRKSVVPL